MPPMDHSHLARVSRRQPDARGARRAADAAHLPEHRRGVLAVARDAGRTGAVLRQDGRARAGGGAGAGAGVVGRAPRPRRLAVAADQQPVTAHGAGNLGSA